MITFEFINSPVGDRVEIVDLRDEVDYFAEIEQFDSLIAYHGTTSRFQDSIQEYGPHTNSQSGVNMNESQAPEEGLLYFGFPRKADFKPEKGEIDSADKFAEYSTEIFGSKPILLKVELDLDNMVIDPHAIPNHLPPETWADNLYDSIVRYGTLAYTEVVNPDRIEEVKELSDKAEPPTSENPYWSRSPEWAEFMDALDEGGQTLSEFREAYSRQLEIQEPSNINWNELKQRAVHKIP